MTASDRAPHDKAGRAVNSGLVCVRMCFRQLGGQWWPITAGGAVVTTCVHRVNGVHKEANACKLLWWDGDGRGCAVRGEREEGGTRWAALRRSLLGDGMHCGNGV